LSTSRRISVFDSTLRDGEQAPGNAMSPDQKVAIALALEAIGVDTVEAGFPSSSPSDFEATRMISEALTRAKFATLNRATPDDIDAAARAGGVDNHQLQIMTTGSDVHLEHKRGISRAEGLRETVEAFRHARSLGFTDITLGIEDASRGSDDLLRPLIDAAIGEGAVTVALADTTGCMIPAEFGALAGRVRSWIPDETALSVHCHNDMGLSLANALVAIEAGADVVQCTLAGIGERTGNTPLEELVAVLTYKADQIGARTDVDPAGLYQAYLLLQRSIGLVTSPSKPVFGANAFATEAGIHQAGMMRHPITYEYVEPHRFGRERTILVGRHSGRNVVRHLLREMGAAVEKDLEEDAYQQYIANRRDRDCISIGELRDILSSRLAARTSTAAAS
jgi:2-isopropylmalate synthase